MRHSALPTRRRAIATCVLSSLSVLLCAGLVAAAVLVPAPPLAVPFIVVVGIGYPMVAAWQAGTSVAVLVTQRLRRPERRALGQLRRELDELPETHHPLGL